MQTIVVSIPCRDREKNYFKEHFPEYEFIFCSKEEMRNYIEEASVVVGQPSLMDIKKAKNLKWIQMGIAGADYYSRNAEVLKDIIVTNVSGAFGQSISEYLLTMTLMLYKKMNLYRDQQLKGIWKDRGKEQTICNKTVLILGTGDIGRSFASLLKAFYTHTIGIKRNGIEKIDGFQEIYPITELGNHLPRADILALCLPSTPKTKHLIGLKEFQMMKKGAVVLNVGRGDTIVTDDLVKALKKGYISGAGLDVTDPEPLWPTHPLWNMEQVIITPHVSGGSFEHLEETYQKILEICICNLEHYRKAQKLEHVVNLIEGY